MGSLGEGGSGGVVYDLLFLCETGAGAEKRLCILILAGGLDGISNETLELEPGAISGEDDPPSCCCGGMFISSWGMEGDGSGTEKRTLSAVPDFEGLRLDFNDSLLSSLSNVYEADLMEELLDCGAVDGGVTDVSLK